jgi:hypothetical protein
MGSFCKVALHMDLESIGINLNDIEHGYILMLEEGILIRIEMEINMVFE